MLDVLVYLPAYEQWDAVRYRGTVSDAASSVNSYTQKRLGRFDISDKDLMAQTFSEKPPEVGARRLWCPGNRTSLTVRSQQEGAKLFAMGCYAAIRNPAHHLTGEWLPTTAFEYLAAFSIVVRWVRSWDIVCHPDDVAEFFRQLPRAFAGSRASDTRPRDLLPTPPRRCVVPVRRHQRPTREGLSRVQLRIPRASRPA